MIPAWLVSLFALLWGIIWIIYARVHKVPSLNWLALPIFAVSLVYAYYTFWPVQIEIRAIVARSALLAIAFSQIAILSIFIFFEREYHEHH